MTDQVASELADSGHRSAGEYHQTRQWQHWNLGESELIPHQPRLIDMRQRLADDHPAVGRAITAAWQLAATAEPPPGSVRSGPVVLLLDEAPGIPLDISDAPRTAELLDALTAAADRSQRT